MTRAEAKEPPEGTLNASIFISYRRADTGGHAGRLHDRLAQWFDADALFYDLDSIDSGQVFPARLEQAVNAASVVLMLIGPDWLAELNRRASVAETDFVRWRARCGGYLPSPGHP
jgi:hypothetical protein